MENLSAEVVRMCPWKRHTNLIQISGHFKWRVAMAAHRAPLSTILLRNPSGKRKGSAKVGTKYDTPLPFLGGQRLAEKKH